MLNKMRASVAVVVSPVLFALPRNMNEYATTFIPQPEIAPADYDRIRETAAQFIEILQPDP